MILICGFLTLWIGLICFRTSEIKESWIKKAIIMIWLVLCIGAFGAYLMDLVHVPIMANSIGVLFLLLGILVWGYSIKKRAFQAFSFSIHDVISTVILVVFMGILFLKSFGTEIFIAYINSDPAAHFELAREIMQTHSLNRMYFGALYNSMIMELMAPYLGEITLYKAFILGDASLNVLHILLFYVVISKYCQGKIMKILVPIITILYFCGWPLHSWIEGGYVYFGAGVSVFLLGLYLLELLKEKDSKKIRILLWLMLGIVIFALLQCYMLFLPMFLFSTIVSYKKIIKKQLSLRMKQRFVMVVVLGFSLCFCGIFCGYFHGDIHAIFRGLSNEGGIYRQLYKDFVFLIPFALMFCSKRYSERNNILSNFIIIYFAAIIFAFVLKRIQLMSGYYYYKLYYPFWALLWVATASEIDYLWNDNRRILLCNLIPIIAYMVLEYQNIEVGFNHNFGGKTECFFPIYEYNEAMMDEVHVKEYNNKQNLVSVCQVIWDNLEEEEQIYLIGEGYFVPYAKWYRAFTGYECIRLSNDNGDDIQALEQCRNRLKEEGYNYFCMIQATDIYCHNVEWFQQFETFYSDGYYAIYKMN